MAHTIDFVFQVMKGLSSTSLRMFQRDGSLYVVSPEGFAQITHALETEPKEISDWSNDEQPPEIQESEKIIRSVSSQRFLTGESRYVKAISTGKDKTSFSLDDMAKVHERLSELPDDGLIRMIDQSNSYHSHKHGYGADGINVRISNARRMERDRYLELMTEKEDEFIENLEQIAKGEDPVQAYLAFASQFRDYIIMTSDIIVSVPRPGVLSRSLGTPNVWRDSTELEERFDSAQKGGILNYYGNEISERPVDHWEESPFGVYVHVNTQSIAGNDIFGFTTARNELMERLNHDVDSVLIKMDEPREFLARLNALHQEICAEQIEERKERSA